MPRTSESIKAYTAFVQTGEGQVVRCNVNDDSNAIVHQRYLVPVSMNIWSADTAASQSNINHVAQAVKSTLYRNPESTNIVGPIRQGHGVCRMCSQGQREACSNAVSALVSK